MEIDPNRAIEYIQHNANKFAQAKADRIFIENYLKTVKSRVMNESDSSSLGAKEAEAYASANYVEQLNALKVAVEQEETLKFMLIAAQARIDVWKTTEYSKRAEMRNL
tara:strand:+ start:934 stop:1257 length:324 start_codon:yes stop_codon:yes gene_type:complete